MGFLDSIFGRDKKEAPVSLMTPEQQGTQRRLITKSTPLAEAALGRYGQPYPGEMLTKFEEAGLSTLGEHLGKPLPTESTVYEGAVGELEKTFAGDYDPVGSLYYQSYRTAVMRELEEAKDRIAARTSASDKFFGGGRIATEGELEESAMTDLAQVLGGMYERERDKRLGAVPVAMGALGAGEALERDRVAASQQFGGLEFQREYGDYLRQMQELGIPLETAINLATTKNEYYQPGYEPSFFERIIQPIAMAAAGGVGSTVPYPSLRQRSTGGQGQRPGTFRG